MLLRAVLLLILAMTAGAFATWVAPRWEAYRARSANVPGVVEAVGPLERTARPPEAKHPTAVLDERLREAERCMGPSATLHRFTFDATERVATMNVLLEDPQALDALLDCLNSEADESRWRLLNYEAVQAEAASSAQRSGRLVLSTRAP